MNFRQFTQTRIEVADVRQIEGYGWEDMYDEPTHGFIYNGGTLFIEQLHGDRFDLYGEYFVELFGDDWRGSLTECEAELYAAAHREGVWK